MFSISPGINVSSRTTHVAEGFSLPIPRDLKVTFLWRSKDLRYVARAEDFFLVPTVPRGNEIINI